MSKANYAVVKKSEKDVEFIARKFICSLLNITEYSTAKEKGLYGVDLPDGSIYNDCNQSLLIMEFKTDETKHEEGINQIYEYIDTVKANPENGDIIIYACLCWDYNKLQHEFYKYDEAADILQPLTDNDIRKIFMNTKFAKSAQTLHDMTVRILNKPKQEDLQSILCAIIATFDNSEILAKYEKMNSINDTDKFNEQVITNLERYADNEKYKKTITYIKNTTTTDFYELCKAYYDTYKANPQIITTLHQQFKKYVEASKGQNEIWTDLFISNIMFKECDDIIKNRLNLSPRDKIYICDPCIGGGNLITPFLNDYPKIEILGCEIDESITLTTRLNLKINGYKFENVNITNIIYNLNRVTYHAR